MGDAAGSSDGRYATITIDCVSYGAHRIAWFWVHGEMPKEQIDHINGNRMDNRIANLRCVSASVNQQNQRRPHRTNSTGYLGVVPVRRGQFRAQIWVSGAAKNLGTFDTPQEAHAVYLHAKRLRHEGCTL